MSGKPIAWMGTGGVIYMYPKSTIGLRPLGFLDDNSNVANARRYKAFRKDILTKAQPIMTAVAATLCQPVSMTTEDMVDRAFDKAML